MYPGAQAKIRPFIHTYPRTSGKADRHTSRTRVAAAFGPGGRIGSQQTHRWRGESGANQSLKWDFFGGNYASIPIRDLAPTVPGLSPHKIKGLGIFAP